MRLQRAAIIVGVLLRLTFYGIDPLGVRKIMPISVNGLILGVCIWLINTAWALNLLRYTQCLWKLNKRATGCEHLINTIIIVLIISDLVSQVIYSVILSILWYENKIHKTYSLSIGFHCFLTIEVLVYFTIGYITLREVMRIKKDLRSPATQIIISKVQAFLVLGTIMVCIYWLDLLALTFWKKFRNKPWRPITSLISQWSYCTTIVLLTSWRKRVIEPVYQSTTVSSYNSTNYWPDTDDCFENQGIDDENTCQRNSTSILFPLGHQQD